MNEIELAEWVDAVERTYRGMDEDFRPGQRFTTEDGLTAMEVRIASAELARRGCDVVVEPELTPKVVIDGIERSSIVVTMLPNRQFRSFLGPDASWG